MIALLSAAPLAWADTFTSNATEIYFVRHAETVSNATHQQGIKNNHTLSRLGKKQVKRLTAQLKQLDIDYILVGPQQRALKTILPFLKAQKRTAEIWPSLDECCWQEKPAKQHAAKLKFGPKIKLNAKMKPYFVFPNAHYRFYTQSYNEGLTQVQVAVDTLLRRFGNSGKHILVVGDYHSGTRIIELLQGMQPEGWYKLNNAKIVRLIETSDSNFVLNSAL